ncbi:MAG: hypothetical protein JWL83_3712 [Actinomycetia bacterium]|nr:hypothetical protein [Actinomycetes bacterium]
MRPQSRLELGAAFLVGAALAVGAIGGVGVAHGVEAWVSPQVPTTLLARTTRYGPLAVVEHQGWGKFGERSAACGGPWFEARAQLRGWSRFAVSTTPLPQSAVFDRSHRIVVATPRQAIVPGPKTVTMLLVHVSRDVQTVRTTDDASRAVQGWSALVTTAMGPWRVDAFDARGVRIATVMVPQAAGHNARRVCMQSMR